MRDPRVEPRVGDLLRNVRGNTRAVTRIYGTKAGATRVAFTLTFAGDKDPINKQFTESIRDWRAAVSNDAIVHAEGE